MQHCAREWWHSDTSEWALFSVTLPEPRSFMTFLAPSATADSILAWWHSSSTRRSRGLMIALSEGEGKHRGGLDNRHRQMQHWQSLHLNKGSPITSLLSKLSSLAWLALRICILMNSILVLLSWSICCAVANSLRSCEKTEQKNPQKRHNAWSELGSKQMFMQATSESTL